MLNKAGQTLNIHTSNNLCELQQLNLRFKADVIIINPSYIQQNLKHFIALKNEYKDTLWIAMVYAFFDQDLLSVFDEIISINDSPCNIITAIRKRFISNQTQHKHREQQKVLSDREVDVLKHLIDGNSNKEIADKLNISVNTVISHRKNISIKTGIHSVSGLTIYAIINKIITIDSYQE
jgi:DNA-binding NarL/FixJ family response regulator